MTKSKAIFKFNSGNLALLCSNCSVIIKTGIDFNEEERKAVKGEKFLKAQYCNYCTSIKNKNMKLNLTKINANYEVRFKTKLIGHFILDVDGFYYWQSLENAGYYSSWVLKLIANNLDELNKPYEDSIKEYLKSK